MSEEKQETTTADQNALRTFEYDRVKTLFDYTKFHIGLYLTIGTLLVGVVGTKAPIAFRHWLLWLAVFFIGLAGFAGGMIASTLPYCKSLSTFETLPSDPATESGCPESHGLPSSIGAFGLALSSVFYRCCLGRPRPPASPPSRA
jgi:hypothetical protein